MDNLKQFALRTYTLTTAFLHNGLAVFGAVAAIALLMGARPVVDPGTQSGPASAAFGTIRHEGITLLVPTADTENPEYRTLAVYLSRRYKVAQDATEQLVGAAHEAGSRTGMDPLLILAVMAVESRFNPIAESVMGAKGLMQVIPKFHQDKLDALGRRRFGVRPHDQHNGGRAHTEGCRAPRRRSYARAATLRRRVRRRQPAVCAKSDGRESSACKQMLKRSRPQSAA